MRTLPPLRCTACKTGALSPNDDGSVRCGRCKRVYPRRDGYIDLLPPRTVKPSPGQAAMESEAIVSIYESRLWRRGPVAYALMGLTFDRESALVSEGLAARESETVLDLGCGSGIYTRPIARAVSPGQVIGLDISPPMLAHAARKAMREGIRNVTWVRGSAMELPFEDQSLDAVNCCGALHIFPDMEHVLGEIHRVLRPGGRFTTATVRRPGGAFGPAITDILKAVGSASFEEGYFANVLERSGFDSAEKRFARGIWMVWRAQRAA